MLPLQDLFVLDLSQFLAGPAATLRLADLGARVVKVEHPVLGDLCRRLYVSNVDIDGDSTLFHAINRNKESVAADLKNPDDLSRVHGLIRKADVVVQNFRPGVARRLSVDYDSARGLNPKVVYGSISGYGTEGPWCELPGQDLLAQSRSGLLWLMGSRGDPPTPVGLAVADMLAGAHLVQGILACLVRRATTGRGGLVETSLLESLIDFQFEVLTTYLNDPLRRPPDRGTKPLAHSYLSAPYGVYRTLDGHLGLAMGSISALGRALELPQLERATEPSSWFDQRDKIISALADHLKNGTTSSWLARLEPAGIWCAEVLDWPQLLEHEGFRVLQMLQHVGAGSRSAVTTRCPVRIDGERLHSSMPAPRIGEHRPDLW